MRVRKGLLGNIYMTLTVLFSLCACGGPVVGDDPEEVISKMPRWSIRDLKNVHLSIVSEDWRYAEPSQPSLKQSLEEEIREKVGRPGFWAPPSSPLGKEPELVVIGSAGRIGTERSIIFFHAYITEVVTVVDSKSTLRAITWYGKPWYGSAYPAVLESTVKEGRDFILTDLARGTGH